MFKVSSIDGPLSRRFTPLALARKWMTRPPMLGSRRTNDMTTKTSAIRQTITIPLSFEEALDAIQAIQIEALAGNSSDQDRQQRIDLCLNEIERSRGAKHREKVKFIMRKINPNAAPARRQRKPRAQVIRHAAPARRQTKQRGSSARSQAKSGDSNKSSSDPDPDPSSELRLLDQYDLADLLRVSVKTIQNIFSATPHKLPKSISIPGARGPRWTIQSIKTWVEYRPQHTAAAPEPVAKRKVGRPRLALAKQGGAS